MKTRGLVVLLLSGCVLVCNPRPALALRRYFRVDDIMNWPTARRHCRERFTDLATVENDAGNDEAEKVGGRGGTFWIGLYRTSWQWSSGVQLDPQSYTNWAQGEPSSRRCVVVTGGGSWFSRDCEDKHHFLCSNDGGHVFIKTPMDWKDAQDFCRGSYQDLSVILTEEENLQVQDVLNGQDTTNGTTANTTVQNQNIQNNSASEAWFGLFRPLWKWSDGSTATYRKWAEVQPEESECVAMESGSGQWTQRPCSNKYAVLCYSEVSVSAVRMVHLRLSSAVLMEWAVQESVLQQMRQKLVERGAGEDLKLSWRRRPDGKMFHKVEEEEKKEQSTPCRTGGERHL